jgi:alpha-beta hydrolase superfamily lysophospholipase
MDSPKFSLLAEALCEMGIGAARFDFRGCGQSDGAISDTTVSGRLADLQAVLNHLREVQGLGGPFGVMGSSMGGYVSLLAFAARGDLQATAVWATPFDLKGLSSQRGHPDLSSLGPAFFEDLPLHDLAPLDTRLHHLLIIHGERDEVVPHSHAHRLFKLASEPKELCIIPGGDHRFTNPAHRVRAGDLTLHWFRRWLGGTH